MAARAAAASRAPGAAAERAPDGELGGASIAAGAGARGAPGYGAERGDADALEEEADDAAEARGGDGSGSALPAAGQQVDYTPDIFCDSDRCVREEVREIARSVDSARATRSGSHGA